MLRKFWPYYSLLKGARRTFIAGILAGVVYAVASGFGFPMMVKVVFPIIFDSEVGKELVVEGQVSGEQASLSDETSMVEGEMGGLRKKWEEWKEIGSKFQNKEEIREVFTNKWGAEKGRRFLLIAACALLPLVAGIRGIAGFFNVYWTTASGLHVLLQLQQKVFVKLQKLPLGFFSGRKTGDLISRVINDSMMLQAMISTLTNDLIKQPFTLLAALSYLTYDSIHNKEGAFLLIFLISIPLVILPIRFIGKRLMRRAATMQAHSGNNTAILTETLSATREIRAFNLEELMASRFLQGITSWTMLQMKVIRYRFSTTPMIEVVAAVAVAASLGYGASRGFSFERFVAVVIALYMCYDPAKKLGEVYNRLKQCEASVDRLEEVLQTEEEVVDPQSPVELEQVKGALSFQNVSFSYDGDHAALHEISVDIPAGQIVALVGPSGAGKTTFASMIPRFYDPTQGAITLDGVDIKELRLKALRDVITLVPQEAILLSGSIAENIQLGKLGAALGEIQEAARLANVDEFIGERIGGYDSQVGERGTELSGGQRQRISMARAFLKNAPVLILDEATASLDSESESLIQESLSNLAKGRTTLIIAHRFSSIRIADRILVFEDGKIVGDGTFEELEKSHSLFRKLLRNQQA